MSPVVKRRKVTAPTDRTRSSRRPLTTSNPPCDDTQLLPNLIEIFNNSQHVTSSDQALTQLKKLYNSADFKKFEPIFMDCLKKLLKSKQTIYFKTSCEFLCKFLQHVTNLQDDRLVRSSIDVADHYMQVAHEDCRFNAIYFVCKFLSHVESLDEEICKALKLTLPKRIRDKKASIRAQAVLASRKFQDNKMIQEGFLHHFNRDPELTVRKALLQTMDIDIFGYDFLVESTQDSHEAIRKAAFQRLGKVPPSKLNSEQLHRVLHNGLFERERQASFSFKTHTLDPWLSKFYDGIDLIALLEPFNVVDHVEDIERLLEFIYERDLDQVEGNGTTTKLHQVAESFRDRWLASNNKCLPILTDFNDRVALVWLSLVKFCKSNRAVIKTIRVRTIRLQTGDPNSSIEEILDSQEQNDEVAELYERLTPDLINLVDFIKRYVRNADQVIKTDNSAVERLELVYHKLMDFLKSYEVGDDLERKTVQEVLALVLKENLLTEKFSDFIVPVIKSLFTLVYSKSSNLMINYISELINNVRSHLEDIVTPSQAPHTVHSMINPKTPKSTKKVTISKQLPTRSSLVPVDDEQNLEFKIATIRIDLEELKDKLDDCVKNKDFDQAKSISNKIDDLKAELNILHGRRYSIASDVSHMSLILESDPDNNKLSSTMLANEIPTDDQDDSMTEQRAEMKVFKHHTNELVKCLQMYFACLQCVRVSEVAITMRNHLNHLTYECLDDWFKNNTRVRRLMVACNGLTALVDRDFASLETTKALLVAGCYDNSSLEIKTIAFQSIVDVMIEHEGLEMPMEKIEKFLKSSLREYGKYDPRNIKKTELEHITVVVQGTAKLYYHQRLNSPEILAHLILWWYHPRTYSKLTQFIGVFLPTFVKHVGKKTGHARDDWLQELLAETFVTSVEYLHDYILGPGFNIMAESDMHSLISFLSNLLPISYHPRAQEVIDKRIDDLPSGSQDLIKYMKQSKNNLENNPSVEPNENLKRERDGHDQEPDLIARPINLFD